MDEFEFDQFADEYQSLHKSNIKLSGEEPEFFARYKVADVASRARTLNLKVDAILDFGSGIGSSIPHFRDLLPSSSLVCADVSRKSLDIAAQRFPNSADLYQIREHSLGAIPRRFDILFSACVFHHIPQEEHAHWLSELRAVAEPGAMLAIFEHNPLNPLTVHAVNTCPFDANAHLIPAQRLQQAVRSAGWSDVCIEYRLFFPRFLSRFRPWERYLIWLPVGAQYAVYGRA